MLMQKTKGWKCFNFTFSPFFLDTWNFFNWKTAVYSALCVQWLLFPWRAQQGFNLKDLPRENCRAWLPNCFPVLPCLLCLLISFSFIFLFYFLTSKVCRNMYKHNIKSVERLLFCLVGISPPYTPSSVSTSWITSSLLHALMWLGVREWGCVDPAWTFN